MNIEIKNFFKVNKSHQKFIKNPQNNFCEITKNWLEDKISWNFQKHNFKINPFHTSTTPSVINSPITESHLYDSFYTIKCYL